MDATGWLRQSQPKDDRAAPVDQLTIRLTILNDRKSEIVLPSKMLQGDIQERDDAFVLVVSYKPWTFADAKRSYPVIPSRESFAPIAVRPGECMHAELEHPIFAPAHLATKPVRVVFRTSPFLIERFTFTSVELTSTLKLVVGNHAL